MNRTDSEKLGKLPIIVCLGGKEYNIHPKPLRQSRLWKEKAKDCIEDFEHLFRVDYTNTQDAISALRAFLFDTLDELIDLVFEWEPDLPKDEILDTATEDEMLNAVFAVMELAFPLAQRFGINLSNMKSMRKDIPNQS